MVALRDYAGAWHHASGPLLTFDRASTAAARLHQTGHPRHLAAFFEAGPIAGTAFDRSVWLRLCSDASGSGYPAHPLPGRRLRCDLPKGVIGVDRPPEPVLLALDRDHDLVEMPPVRRAWALAAESGRELPAKARDPVPHGLVGNADPACGKQILDVPEAESEPMIGPDSVADHGARNSAALDAGQVG